MRSYAVYFFNNYIELATNALIYLKLIKINFWHNFLSKGFDISQCQNSKTKNRRV
jgi:hypothetical protein